MNENKLTREQAIAHVLTVEEEINRKVATQYIGMVRMKGLENFILSKNPLF